MYIVHITYSYVQGLIFTFTKFFLVTLVWPIQIWIHYCTQATRVRGHCISKPSVHILLTFDSEANDKKQVTYLYKQAEAAEKLSYISVL